IPDAYRARDIFAQRDGQPGLIFRGLIFLALQYFAQRDQATVFVGNLHTDVGTTGNRRFHTDGLRFQYQREVVLQSHDAADTRARFVDNIPRRVLHRYHAALVIAVHHRFAGGPNTEADHGRTNTDIFGPYLSLNAETAQRILNGLGQCRGIVAKHLHLYILWTIEQRAIRLLPGRCILGWRDDRADGLRSAQTQRIGRERLHLFQYLSLSRLLHREW